MSKRTRERDEIIFEERLVDQLAQLRVARAGKPVTGQGPAQRSLNDVLDGIADGEVLLATGPTASGSGVHGHMNCVSAEAGGIRSVTCSARPWGISHSAWI
jgi:hypothetical protein